MRDLPRGRPAGGDERVAARGDRARPTALAVRLADEASEQLGLDVTAEDVVRAVARETYLRERDRELALAMRA